MESAVLADGIMHIKVQHIPDLNKVHIHHWLDTIRHRQHKGDHIDMFVDIRGCIWEQTIIKAVQKPAHFIADTAVQEQPDKEESGRHVFPVFDSCVHQWRWVCDRWDHQCIYCHADHSLHQQQVLVMWVT